MNADTRKQLGLPPIPVNDNHRREEAHTERLAPVPVCGLLGLYALGFVCGMAIVMAYNVFFS